MSVLTINHQYIFTIVLLHMSCIVNVGLPDVQVNILVKLIYTMDQMKLVLTAPQTLL